MQLTAIECVNCGKLYIPPKYMCPECGNSEFKKVALSQKGKVLTYTTIRVPPLGFESQAPYHVGIVELDRGIKLTCRIISPGGKPPDIGDEVSFVKKDNGAYWFEELER